MSIQALKEKLEKAHVIVGGVRQPLQMRHPKFYSRSKRVIESRINKLVGPDPRLIPPELNISTLLDRDCSEFSASVAEKGENAGQETWFNALESSLVFVTPRNRSLIVEFFKGFGAWEDLEEWPLNELNALLIQFCAGDIREAQSCAPGEGLGGIDWDEYENQSAEGQVGGRLFVSEGKLYTCIGS